MEDNILKSYYDTLSNKQVAEEELLSIIEQNPKLILDELEKAETPKSFSDLFMPYVDLIKAALENKIKRYADALIFNSNGEILMLLRFSNKDSNEPLNGKWCLPGGHVDEGETTEQAVTREILEETNFVVDSCSLRYVKRDDKCKIFYYSCYVDPDQITILDNSEHLNLKWVNRKELQELDCIYDLKDTLNKIAFPIYEEPIIKADGSLEELANKLAEDTLKQIENIEKALETIKIAYDNDEISGDIYFEAIQKAKIKKKVLHHRKDTGKVYWQTHILGNDDDQKTIDEHYSHYSNELMQRDTVMRHDERMVNAIIDRIYMKGMDFDSAVNDALKKNREGIHEERRKIIEARARIAFKERNKYDPLDKVNDQRIKNERSTTLVSYLEMLSKMNAHPKQKAFFDYQFHNAKVISLTPTSEIRIKHPEIDKYLNERETLIKQCYKNAADLTMNIEGVDYVEGLINVHSIPIEHAWNKIGDEYFDITKDIALNSSSYNNSAHVAIIELKSDDILKYSAKTGAYGSYLYEKYLDDNKLRKSDDENNYKLGDETEWHGRKFKRTTSGWTHIDNEKSSKLKTEKNKKKLRIQDFDDNDLELHAERSSIEDLNRVVKESRHPKLRDIAAKHLANRKAKENEHSLYELMVMEDVEDHTYMDDKNAIHLSEMPDEETIRSLNKHGIKYIVDAKEVNI